MTELEQNMNDFIKARNELINSITNTAFMKWIMNRLGLQLKKQYRITD